MPAGNYKRPPIEEALCELRFAPGPEWNLTIPGQLYTLVRHDYDGKPRQQNVLNANLAVPQHGAGPPALAMQHALGRLQFPTAEGTRMLSVGPDLLVVHTLRPYDGWIHFRPRIESAVERYRSVAQPTALARLGVRYINRITFAVEPGAVPLGDYFECAPPAIPGLPTNVSGFFHRDEYMYEDGLKLLTTFASIDGAGSEAAFLLDLDVIWEGEPRPLDDVMALVDNLHTREGAAFESMIRDPLRGLFDA